MKHNKYWFKPKRYGYGAYPISWEGWLLIAVFVILMILNGVFILSYNEILFLMAFVFITFLLVYISAKKTKGKWEWRWAGK